MKKTENILQKRLPLYLLVSLLSIVLLFVAFRFSPKPPVQSPATNIPATENKNENTTVDKTTAIEKVKNLPKVKEYLVQVPNAQVVVDHEDPETDSWVIHVFEVKNGHTATFNWYTVNKMTGKITAEFDIPSVQGE